MATSALGRSKSFSKKNCVCMTICRRGLGNEHEEREQSGQKGIHRGAWRGPGVPAEPWHRRQAGCSAPTQLGVTEGGRQLKPASGFTRETKSTEAGTRALEHRPVSSRSRRPGRQLLRGP